MQDGKFIVLDVTLVTRGPLPVSLRNCHCILKGGCLAEVVLFTAGLEDYAAPICTALEKRYGCFTAKLFRPATVPSEVYPCVKVQCCTCKGPLPTGFFDMTFKSAVLHMEHCDIAVHGQL